MSTMSRCARALRGVRATPGPALGALALLAALLGCAAGPAMGQARVAGAADSFYDKSVEEGPDFRELAGLVDTSAEGLDVAREQAPDYSPDADPMRFTFCPSPAQTGMHLKNTAWLAFLAANQYSHLSVFAPLLLELGFGSGGDLFWPLCYRDLSALRALEKSGAMPARLDAAAIEGWGVCAREWFEERYLRPGNSPPPGVAAAFEAYLVQESSTSSDLQFFAGGAFSTSGREFKQGSTQVVWARHAELPVVIVAFRGTEPSSLKDIVTDAMAWKQSLSDHGWTDGWGKVHAGFMTGFRSVSEAVHPVTKLSTDAMLLKKLEEIEGGGEAECTMEHPCIWVTGHSLGAALATLFASRVLSEIERGRRFKLKGLYTFGSPRVGNAEFKDKFERLAHAHGLTHVRVRNENDIVTRVPRLFYKHINTLGYLSAQPGEVVVDAVLKEPLVGSPGDHSMGKYHRKLVEALARPEHAAMSACAYTP